MVILLISVLVILVFLLFSPTPVESTAFGSQLAKFAASLFDPSGENLGDTLKLLEMWLNVLVFFPFSAIVYLVFKRFRAIWSLVISLLLSVCAELTQKFFLTSRVSSFQDVLLNFAGAVLGVTIVSIFSQRCRTNRN